MENRWSIARSINRVKPIVSRYSDSRRTFVQAKAVAPAEVPH
jgi:hypothetical protein